MLKLAGIVVSGIVRELATQKVSRCELARRLNLKSQNIAAMLNTGRSVSLETIERVAVALGVEPVVFFAAPPVPELKPKKGRK